MSKDTDKPAVEYVYCHVRMAHSLFVNLTSVVLLLGAVAIGKWLDSSALQWVAALMWFFAVWSIAFSHYQKRRMTPQALANKLKADFNVVAE